MLDCISLLLTIGLNLSRLCWRLTQREAMTQTVPDSEEEARERQRGAREGVFILRQQLKWVIIALKFYSDWAPLTCRCESSHKENGIFRESCTLTLVN